mgnify:CR=1 FL=1
MASKRARLLRLGDLERNLAGVERWLRDLRHNRGRWPRQWCKGMITHYDNRRMQLRAEISRIKRELAAMPQPKRRR